MPGQRKPGQKLVPIPMSDGFRRQLDRAYPKEGYDSRAKFVRDAVAEKLRGLGYPVEPEEAAAPARVQYTRKNRTRPILLMTSLIQS